MVLTENVLRNPAVLYHAMVMMPLSGVPNTLFAWLLQSAYVEG